MQTIESNITDGELHEIVANVVVNSTVVPGTPGTIDMGPILIQTARNMTGNAHGVNDGLHSSMYVLTKIAMLGMQSWFAELSTNGSVSCNKDNLDRMFTSTDNAGIIKANSIYKIDSGV